MDYLKLAGLLYPDVDMTPEQLEEKYPSRPLPEGAKVTRFAPSPTGFVHFGGLFPILVDERLAHQSGGVFYLRIEDTDSKREVKGAELDLINVFRSFGIEFDESITAGGAYGPYRQSDRKDIYTVFAKKLVSEGRAYPCFCSAEKLGDARKKQEQDKQVPGYYGGYAACRELSYDQVRASIDAGLPFVLRFRSEGSEQNRIKFTDLVKGTVEITENFIDHVLLKSDGMPTYHFAHAVDDHLMRTTHVVRGEEWLSSVPYHVQLFGALGFRLPKYLHIAQLMKSDGTSKKKLSKRDLGTGLNYYVAEGYPSESVIEYMMTLLNSNYEDWRRANPGLNYKEFDFSIKKMSSSGSIFDLVKFNDISKNIVAAMDAEAVYEKTAAWAVEHDTDFYNIISGRAQYTVDILSIGRGGAKPRKDLAKWSDVKPYISFFFDEYFKYEDEIPQQYDKNDIVAALETFSGTLDISDDSEAWFGKIKDICPLIGYCQSTKDYKQSPGEYGGHVGDVSMFIRIAVTGRMNSPDLYSVIQLLGKEKTIERIKSYIKGMK